MVALNGTPAEGDLVGVLTDRSALLAHVDGTPLPILPSRASGFGGVGRPAFEPKNKSFFELELRAGLTAPSSFGVDCPMSDSRRLSRPSEGALGGWRSIGDGSGDGPPRSQGRSWLYEVVVGDEEDGGDNESMERRFLSTALRPGIDCPLPDAVCETSIRMLGGAMCDREIVVGDATVSCERPATELSCQRPS